MKRVLTAVGWVMAAAMVAAAPDAGKAAAPDPGKAEIGTIRTELIYGTDGPVNGLGKGIPQLSNAEKKRLTSSKQMGFKNFIRLGSDDQPILKGYKNWAKPMAGSEAIMVTFQPQGFVGATKRLRMDLELWQQKKMVLRTDPVLDQGRRVYILGPKWREGNLIITVELVELKEK